MQVSFGKGLIAIGGKFYNPDAIASFENVPSSKGEKTRVDFIDGKTDYPSGDYSLGEIASACIEAQAQGSISYVNEKTKKYF